jgi:glycine cleavage system H lipoate-binding protein
MFPGVSGFAWDTGHMLFLGVFFGVLAVIGGTLIAAFARSVRDFRRRRDPEICWETDFEDLPRSARHCRHEFTGEYKERVCERAFDCRTCAEHARLDERNSGVACAPDDETVYGFLMPNDRYYHRGHTWVRTEEDGTATIGLDDFGKRMAGAAETPEFPEVGSRISVNGVAWRTRRDGRRFRILSPLDGIVVATGGAGNAWYLKVKPEGDAFDLRHLLRGGEVRPWIMREMERLHRALASKGVGLSLADGGVPVDDFPAGYPGADWDAVWGEMFLEP